MLHSTGNCVTLILHPNINSFSNKSIILDVDETLVHTYDEMPTPEVLEHLKKLHNNRIYIFTADDLDGDGDSTAICWGVFRPGVKRFLDFCFAYFQNVIFWSAGEDRYVKKLVEKLTANAPKPNLIFTRDKCESTLIGSDYVLTKPLEDIIKKFPNNESLRIELLLALDDRHTTFEHNKDNGIPIPPYTPTIDNMDKYDNALEKLEIWLLSPNVVQSKDVLKLNKSKIFQ